MFVHVFAVYVMLQQTRCYSAKAVNFSQLLNEATLAELLCSPLLCSGLVWASLVWPCLVWSGRVLKLLLSTSVLYVCVSYLGQQAGVCVRVYARVCGGCVRLMYVAFKLFTYPGR